MGNPEKNFFYSPWDVINNPKKYKDEMERIEKSNLKYPIIISGNNIIDGVHRLAKSYLNNKKKIKTYIFSNAEMNKFLISRTKDWNKINKLQTYDFIKLFYKRFCK